MGPFRQLALASLLLAPGIAAADLLPSSQDRSVSAHADLVSTFYFDGQPFPTPSTEDDAAAAAGFEALDADASVTYATANQVSDIGASSISGSGGHDVAAVYQTTGSPPQSGTTVEGSADAESSLRVVFWVDEPTPYQLDAHMEGSTTFGSFDGELRLVRSGSVVFDIVDHLSPDPELECGLGGMTNLCGDASVAGVLLPGSYVLTARTAGGAASFPSNPGLWDGFTSGAWSVDLHGVGSAAPAVPTLSPAALGLLVAGLAAFGASMLGIRIFAGRTPE